MLYSDRQGTQPFGCLQVVSTHATLVWFSYVLLSDVCFKNLNEKAKVDTGVFSNYLSVPEKIIKLIC